MEEMTFEEMRNQIATLRNKLDQQEIINDKLLRHTMKAKFGSINRHERISIVFSVICLVLYPMLYLTNTISLALAIVTCLMMLFCIGATLWFHWPLHKTNLMTADLASVAATMARFKHLHDLWLHYVTPTLLIPWVSWFCYEYMKNLAPLGVNRYYVLIPVLAGVLLGVSIGYRIHRRTVNTAKDIIEQIEGE